MDRRYEKIEVGRLRKKSIFEGTQNTIGSKARLGSEAWGSARDRAAPRLQQTERLALLGTMAAVFAHEVGNPLAGILFSLKLVDKQLEEKKVDDSSLISMIRGAIGELDRLGLLLREFRSLVPVQTLDLKCTDLVTIVEQTLALEMIAYRAAGITVKFDFEDALPLVSIDAARIKQVIVNLCKNAIQAMPNGGCLTLKGYRSQGMVVLEISDTGVGVPEDLNIFELFKTTKPSGTGVGLPLAQQIVSAHNGAIAYKSQLGHGATFKVSLPMYEKAMVGV
jgi:signal transduction histidine kinase